MPDAVANSPKQSFLDSLARCQASGDFLHAFYGRFMASSEEIAEKFAETDFDRQTRLLARSLEITAHATAGDSTALRELNQLALTHDRNHYDIKPGWYAYWVDALVATAAEYDPEWSDELEDDWRRLLGYVTRHLSVRY